MLGVPAGQVCQFGVTVGKLDGDARAFHRSGPAADVAAAQGAVLPDLDGGQAVVERSEVHSLDRCCEVSSALAWHGPGNQEVERQQFYVQEGGF